MRQADDGDADVRDRLPALGLERPAFRHFVVDRRRELVAIGVKILHDIRTNFMDLARGRHGSQ
jgi:hypothetical protein